MWKDWIAWNLLSEKTLEPETYCVRRLKNLKLATWKDWRTLNLLCEKAQPSAKDHIQNDSRLHLPGSAPNLLHWFCIFSANQQTSSQHPNEQTSQRKRSWCAPPWSTWWVMTITLKGSICSRCKRDCHPCMIGLFSHSRRCSTTWTVQLWISQSFETEGCLLLSTVTGVYFLKATWW